MSWMPAGDVVPAVPLSVPMLAVMGGDMPVGAVRVMGLAAHLLALLFAGVLAMLGEKVPSVAPVPDDGRVAGGAAGPLAMAVPGELRRVFRVADAGVVLARPPGAERGEVRVPVMPSLALVMAGLAGGLDLAALEVAASTASSVVPVVGVAVRAVLVADPLEVPG